MSCTVFAFLANVYHDRILNRVEAAQDVPPWKRRRRVYGDMGISADSHRSLYDSTDNTLQSRGPDFYRTSMKPRACFAFAECIENLTRTLHQCTHTPRKSVDAHCTLEPRELLWAIRSCSRDQTDRGLWELCEIAKLNVLRDLTFPTDKRITLFPH